jgi:D-3-phosphoglycerate dehydrogenase
MRLLIAESSNFNSEAADLLRQRFDVELADLDRRHLIERVRDFDLLWVRLRTMIDREVIDAGPKLQAIVTNTTGLNHIDLDYAEERRIRVISLKGETDFLKEIRATAEHTIALTLALLRKIPAAQRHVCEGNWDRTPFMGSEINGKTVGIIGYGRLGKIVANYFAALGARVLIHSRDRERASHADEFACTTLDRLLAESDIVTLHTNWEPANEGMIGRREFGLMKPGGYFINTARGELVDEQAMLDTLEQGHLSGAAIDVIDREHDRGGSFERLTQLAKATDRLVITPHIGGFTRESLAKTELHLANALLNQVKPAALAQSTKGTIDVFGC